MFKQIIISLFSLSLLSSCKGDFSSYFKRSANNKLFDTKGFEGGKRAPLYNKKYISKAKQNVVDQNFDEDDADQDSEEPVETIDPAKRNRSMYLEMIKQDAKQRKQNYVAKMKSTGSSNLSLNQANNIAAKNDYNEQELQKELSEIKAMLKETKANLAKYKCPMAERD